VTAFCILATDAVTRTAKAYRIAREVIPNLPAKDIAVRTVALARIARYAVLLAQCDAEVTAEMEKPVAAICAILARDIGALDTPGLAHLVHLEYDTLITGWQRLIQKHGGQFTHADHRTYADVIAAIEVSQQLADYALAAAAQSLAALAATLPALATEVIQ